MNEENVTSQNEEVNVTPPDQEDGTEQQPTESTESTESAGEETGEVEAPNPGEEQQQNHDLTVIEENVTEIMYILQDEEVHKIETTENVYLPNGDTLIFDKTMTLGDALIAAAIFLLVVFQVVKWLLNMVWRRG